jgi:hypothetical protein
MELDWSASRGFQAGVYRGFDEALRFYAQYFEAFHEIVFEQLSADGPAENACMRPVLPRVLPKPRFELPSPTQTQKRPAVAGLFLVGPAGLEPATYRL